MDMHYMKLARGVAHHASWLLHPRIINTLVRMAECSAHLRKVRMERVLLYFMIIITIIIIVWSAMHVLSASYSQRLLPFSLGSICTFGCQSCWFAIRMGGASGRSLVSRALEPAFTAGHRQRTPAERGGACENMLRCSNSSARQHREGR